MPPGLKYFYKRARNQGAQIWASVFLMQYISLSITISDIIFWNHPFLPTFAIFSPFNMGGLNEYTNLGDNWCFVFSVLLVLFFDTSTVYCVKWNVCEVWFSAVSTFHSQNVHGCLQASWYWLIYRFFYNLVASKLLGIGCKKLKRPFGKQSYNPK